MTVENNNQPANSEPAKVDAPATEPNNQLTSQTASDPAADKPPTNDPATPPTQVIDANKFVAKTEYEALQAQLKELSDFKTAQEKKAEEARLAQLSKEQQLEEQLNTERQARTRAERAALIVTHAVPDALKKLLPEGDVEQLKAYLESADYKAVKAALEKPTQPVQPPANSEPKGANNQPTDPKKPVEDKKVTKWSDIDASSLTSLGKAFTSME